MFFRLMWKPVFFQPFRCRISWSVRRSFFHLCFRVNSAGDNPQQNINRKPSSQSTAQSSLVHIVNSRDVIYRDIARYHISRFFEMSFSNPRLEKFLAFIKGIFSAKNFSLWSSSMASTTTCSSLFMISSNHCRGSLDAE